jgi:hypothetical protein
MRISDDERETLELIMNETHMSVSEVMREAMNIFRSRIDGAQLSNAA